MPCFFGWAPQGTLGAHCGPAQGRGARLARPAALLSPRFACPLSPLGAGNTTTNWAGCMPESAQAWTNLRYWLGHDGQGDHGGGA